MAVSFMQRFKSFQKLKNEILDIRIKLGLLILIIIIPSIIIISLNIINQYKSAKDGSLNHLRQVTNTFSAEQSQTVEGARQLLISLSSTAPIKNLDASSCNTYLSELILNYKRYANFGVADINGNVICSSVTSAEIVNVKNREFFKKAYSGKKFAVGEFQIGQISKKPVLNFGHPITNSDGLITGVVFSSLDLSWVNEFISSSSLEKGSIFSLLDRNGTILARSSESEKWVGRRFPDESLIALSEDATTADVRGVDGVRRLYALNRLAEAEELNANVIVGIPYDLIFQDANKALVLSLVFLLITSGLVILISWKIGNLFLVKEVEVLRNLDIQKTEFVSTASHQLRTPLSGMKMFLELMLDESFGKLNKKQTEIVKNINESNERMIGLVNALLDVSKIELGKLNMNPQIIDLDEILTHVIEDLKPKINSKKIKLTYSNTFKGKVYLDPKFISQAFLNLIDNAVKYSPVDGKLNVNITNKEVFVIIKVIDFGYGISVNEKKRVFQKFYRGNNIESRDIEGNGLGLYITKSIVKECGGFISFTSQKNKGTTFKISLPIFKS
ncbi:MAG: hypothetical protein KBD51_02135 [Candidatus Levybacteria bacterium]|nr:hypothetical protein [Candidatus Levybacteria bacterium]